MFRSVSGVFAIALVVMPFAAQAAEQTVVLDVHHADCVLCAPIVKSTLAHVKGVSTVEVSQPDGMADVTATVTYDDAVVGPAALIKATTEHGYPADLAKGSAARG
jgi:mercuric ion binding protein